MKQETVNFEIDTTVAATTSEIDRLEKIITKANPDDFTNAEWLKMKLELGNHQSNAIMLREYFIPEQKSFQYANKAKHLVELITEIVREKTYHLIEIKNYFKSKHTYQQWDKILTTIFNKN